MERLTQKLKYLRAEHANDAMYNRFTTNRTLATCNIIEMRNGFLYEHLYGHFLYHLGKLHILSALSFLLKTSAKCVWRKALSNDAFRRTVKPEKIRKQSW